MLKTKAKYLIAILLFLVALILFNTNTVNALTQEEKQKLLDLVPDEIYLDIPEIEYEKAEGLIKEQIEKILKDNGINTDESKIEVQGCMPYWGYDYFYNPKIVIYSNEVDSTVSKDVKLTYNNTKNKNASDEQYIKNLKVQNIYYHEVSLNYQLTGTSWIDNFNKAVERDYIKQINDNNLTIVSTFGEGGIDGGINMSGGVWLAIFKNNNLYDIKRMEGEITVPVIDVPQNIEDNQLNEYIIEQIAQYYPEYAKRITKIVKGTTDYVTEIPNGYTIIDSSNSNCYIIVRKKQDSSLQIKDETTNIKIDTDTTVLPANTKLVVKELKEGETYKVAEKLLTNDVDKMYVYDITLQSEGVTVQPDEKVKVSIPIPEGLDTNKLVVYSINDNGTKTEYTVKVETVDNIKYATFETDHFSTYVLGEKAEETTTTNTETTAKGEKDETPKTGATATIAGITALVILIGTVVIIKKCK